jgi:hypothetical protein
LNDSSLSKLAVYIALDELTACIHRLRQITEAAETFNGAAFKASWEPLADDQACESLHKAQLALDNLSSELPN